MNRKQLVRLERLLAQSQAEKKTVTLTFKSPYSLSKALRLVAGRNRVSAFVRKTLVSRLQKELEGYE